MNEKKCNGYESMYTFLSEEDFQKHLETCEDCQKEHARMQRVSELVQEAKPYMLQEKKKQSKLLNAACAAFLVVFATFSVPIYTAGTNIYEDVIAMNEANSLTIEEMGLPVDEYGFLYIN